MTHTDRIIISGMSGRFPDAATLEEFYTNLVDGIESVRPVDREVLWYRNAAVDAAFPPMALLERIDQFDHEFFGLSRREAIQMDPHQRLLIELTHEALEDAGLDRAALSELNTAVFATSPRPEYFQILADLDSLAVTGVLPAGAAGRLAYTFGARGPTTNVDSGCNSAMIAVWQAVQLMRSGIADVAIVGSVSLKVLPEPKTMVDRFNEIMSEDGRCYAFDARAHGTASGEGGGVLVLAKEPFVQQLNLNRRAFILGGACNHNGDRSASFSAPSVTAQSDLLTKAWKDAGVSPDAIQYIEAHGSGTHLGDAVEIRALDRAREAAGAQGPLRIGSVKTNIGHLDHAAGMAGMIKTVLSLERKLVPPSLNFETPNPQLASAKIDVVTEATDLNGSPADLIAGISSFSLVGTNTHIVLQGCDASVTRGDTARDPVLITLSGQNVSQLQQYCERLTDALLDKGDAYLPQDIAYTLSTSHSVHRVRSFVIGRTVDEIAHGIRNAVRTAKDRSNSAAMARIAFLASDDAELDGGPLDRIVFPELAGLHGSFSLNPDDSALQLRLFRQAAIYRIVDALTDGNSPLLGRGFGQFVASIARDEMGLDDAAASEISAVALDYDRLGRIISKIETDGAVTFVNLGRGGELAKAVTKMRPDIEIVEIASCERREDLLQSIGELFTAGAALDLSPILPGRTVSLPSRPFNALRCWPHEPGEVVTLGFAWSGRATDVANGATIGDRSERAEIAIEDYPDGIRSLWARALRNYDVSMDDNFFSLGGNSIIAMDITQNCEQQFGLTVPVTDLYEFPTLGGFVEHIVARARDGSFAAELPSLERLDRSGPMPLSFGQKRLWFLWKLDPKSPAYNLPFQFEIKEAVNVDYLRSALSKFVERHEALRSRFVEQDDGLPQLVIDPPGPVDLKVIDLIAHDNPAAEKRAFFLNEAVQPFDLERNPLYRFFLVRESETQSTFMLNVHHSVDDGWSPPIYFREIAELYLEEATGEPARLPDLPFQYADWAAWLEAWSETEDYKRGVSFWAEHLKEPPVLELPHDLPRPEIPTGEGKLIPVRISKETTAGLKELASQNNTTLFTAMLSIFYCLLEKWTGQQDLIIGTPTSGRQKREFQNVIGFFNNTVALRASMAKSTTLSDLLVETHKVVEGMMRYQDVSFDHVVAAVSQNRSLSSNPLVQALYIHQLIPQYTIDRDLTFEAPNVLDAFEQGDVKGLAPGTAKFDISFVLVEVEDADHLAAAIEYRSDLMSPALAGQISASLEAMLELAANKTDISLAALSAAGPVADTIKSPSSERHRIDLEDTKRLNDIVAEYAKNFPDDTALLDDLGFEASYGELASLIEDTVRHLEAAGPISGKAVGVLLDRSAHSVVSMLAVWAAGGIYVPLVKSLPQSRLEFMIVDSRCAFIISDEPEYHCLTNGFSDCGALHTGARIYRSVGMAEQATELDGDTAYILYTSGSTGRPKGVAVGHRSLVTFCSGASERFEMQQGVRVSSVSPLSFDISIAEVCLALIVGGSSFVVSDAMRANPAELSRLLDDFHVDIFSATPTLMRMMLVAGWVPDPDLQVVSGGEALSRDLAADLLPLVGRLWNAYGPTEATIWCAVREVTADNIANCRHPIIPLGDPLLDSRLEIVDRHGNRVPQGVRGELVVVGPLVSQGYVGLPEKTKAVFTSSLPALDGQLGYRTGDMVRFKDGELLYDGRLDRQLKIRGHRVEPEEVETVVRKEVPDLADVIVEKDGGDERLVAYYSTQSGRALASNKLDTVISHKLPSYLRPSLWVHMDELPRNASGKIDRIALSQVEASREAEAHGPSSSAGHWLAKLVAETTGIAVVDLGQTFFQAGGTSLSAVSLASKLRGARGLNVRIVDIIQAPSLERLANQIENGILAGNERCLMEFRPGDGSSVPLILVHAAGGAAFPYLELVSKLPSTQRIALIQARGLIDQQEPHDSVEDMVSHYIDEISDLYGNAPVRLLGWSAGGVIAVEMAKRMLEMEKSVEFVGLIDSHPVSDRINEAESRERLLLRLLKYNFPGQESQLAAFEKAHADPSLTTIVEFAKSSGLVPLQFDTDDVERFLRTLRGIERAMAAHSVTAYPGKLCVFKASEQERGASVPADLGWGQFCEEIALHTIPGHHNSLVFGRSAEILGHYLTGLMMTMDWAGFLAASGRAAPGDGIYA